MWVTPCRTFFSPVHWSLYANTMPALAIKRSRWSFGSHILAFEGVSHLLIYIDTHHNLVNDIECLAFNFFNFASASLFLRCECS